ncbi:MAG TPA: hypothetical protein PKD17_16445 [Cellvibrionaceae bacterium]|nr:hypothetical protein [Cellvibrionaceae bacterium]HNG59074.1 hypothetical protein [Cellvibrionaceae bacterium]
MKQSCEVNSVWSDAESELILWNEQQRGLGRIELPGRSGLFHSALLGVDIVENQLLIDMPFPSPPIDLVLPHTQCKLSFIKQQQLLQLVVQVEERLLYEGRTALLVKILQREFHCDRRAGARIGFARGQWPLVRMQIPMVEQVRARVINLSSGGALLNIFGRHDTSIQAKAQVAMKLELTDGTCIDVKAAIKSVSYYRRPCQHTQFRVQFLAMSERDARKLDLFIAYQLDQAGKEITFASELEAAY